MSKICIERHVAGLNSGACLVFCCLLVGFGTVVTQSSGQNHVSPSTGRIERPIIVTQVRADRPPTSMHSDGTVKAENGATEPWRFSEAWERARLIIIYPDSSTAVLSKGFASAADPEISFDASHVLFAAKKTAGDVWNIYEMKTDGTGLRRITNSTYNQRHPGYQPKLYTIVSPKPWYQITFVGSEIGVLNEFGLGEATNLYSCRLDGTTIRRLTYNLSDDTGPRIMPDGRLLFAGHQRSTLERGYYGRISLFGINIDGTDYTPFCTDEGRRMKHMPCVTAKGLVVFVEADTLARDGSGSLGCVTLRRPLHSYRAITQDANGFFHSPSPLADGMILVSRRARDGSDTYGVYQLDPRTGRQELLFDDPEYHDLQAKMLYGRPEPDGRSSVVRDNDPNGKLFCMNVYVSDLKRREWLTRGTVKRLRVLEGVPPSTSRPPCKEAPRLAQRRILGDIDIEEDGSFNIEIPANTPVELQTLDANGMALRTCSWIWARNREPRGCIGCHEDAELTPDNILVEAVAGPSIKLTLPPEQRRTVDFRRDVMPIIADKCIQCHDKGGSAPHLGNLLSPANDTHVDGRPHRSYVNLLTPGTKPGYGKYVHPGRARTSPLIWHIFGTNTSRPWDGEFLEREIVPMSASRVNALTEDEKRTFAEWIDMGALWDGIPGYDDRSGGTGN